jgi:hypothetical protein
MQVISYHFWWYTSFCVHGQRSSLQKFPRPLFTFCKPCHVWPGCGIWFIIFIWVSTFCNQLLSHLMADILQTFNSCYGHNEDLHVTFWKCTFFKKIACSKISVWFQVLWEIQAKLDAGVMEAITRGPAFGDKNCYMHTCMSYSKKSKGT